MNTPFAIASTALSMQAWHEASFTYSLWDLGPLDPHLVQLQRDRLSLTLTAVVEYLKASGYQSPQHARLLVLEDALEDFRNLARISFVPQDVTAHVAAILDALERQG